MSIVIHGIVSNFFFYLKQACLYHCLFHYQAEIIIMKFKFNCKLAKCPEKNPAVSYIEGIQGIQ